MSAVSSLRTFLRTLLVLPLLIGAVAHGGEPPGPTASLQIHSARVTRASADLAKRFPGRFYGEGSPGVSLTLLLTLKEGTLLPAGREPLSIETFVDDTYQNLRDPGSDGFGGTNGPGEAAETIQVPFAISTGIGL